VYEHGGNRIEVFSGGYKGISELECAFSRLEGQLKTYVQNSIKAQQDGVWKLIEEGAVIYVCGDAGRMSPDVEKGFS
jgi:cytochrome P450 / NADPH-cytochrome P450 reductase